MNVFCIVDPDIEVGPKYPDIEVGPCNRLPC